MPRDNSIYLLSPISASGDTEEYKRDKDYNKSLYNTTPTRQSFPESSRTARVLDFRYLVPSKYYTSDKIGLLPKKYTLSSLINISPTAGSVISQKVNFLFKGILSKKVYSKQREVILAGKPGSVRYRSSRDREGQGLLLGC